LFLFWIWNGVTGHWSKLRILFIFILFNKMNEAVAAGTGGADGQCPPKTNCKIRITINIKIV
jgi:hypothetical protein